MRRINFLLVDDSNAVNFYNKISIERISRDKVIEIAENGEEALGILKSGVIPDIILLDINMPVMDGWEFIEEFQKFDSEFKRDIKIILMVGAQLSKEQLSFLETIPEIKECHEKMLKRDVLENIIDKYLSSDTTLLANKSVC